MLTMTAPLDAQRLLVNSAANQPLCPQRPGEVGYVGKIVNVKELRYERITQRVVPKLRIGMYHDLELAVTFPIVVGIRRAYDLPATVASAIHR